MKPIRLLDRTHTAPPEQRQGEEFWTFTVEVSLVAFEGKRLDEMRDGTDFIAFVSNVLLGESESAFRSPGADDVGGFGVVAMAATQSHAVNGDELAFERGMRSTPKYSARQRLKRSGSALAKMLEKVWARGMPLGILIHLRNPSI
jgi:hypothetical protein